VAVVGREAERIRRATTIHSGSDRAV
jgi:hypothetical protein